jgi:hypothetical protein
MTSAFLSGARSLPARASGLIKCTFSHREGHRYGKPRTRQPGTSCPPTERLAGVEKSADLRWFVEAQLYNPEYQNGKDRPSRP